MQDDGGTRPPPRRPLERSAVEGTRREAAGARTSRAYGAAVAAAPSNLQVFHWLTDLGLKLAGMVHLGGLAAGQLDGELDGFARYVQECRRLPAYLTLGLPFLKEGVSAGAGDPREAGVAILAAAIEHRCFGILGQFVLQPAPASGDTEVFWVYAESFPGLIDAAAAQVRFGY